MKKMTMLRSIVTVALFTVVGMSLSAQNVATPTAGAANVETGTSDYVTIGSRVPYFVPTDPIIQAMTTAGTMKQSIFKWLVTDATNTNVPGFSVLKYDGSGAAASYDNFRTVTAGTGYYDNEMSILWDAPTYTVGTQYIVKVSEKSVTLSSTVAGCDALNTITNNVYVLARPTVSFPVTEGGGCTVTPGSAYYVPLTVNGLGNWTVTYTVSYNGGAASAPATYNLSGGPVATTDATVIADAAATKLQAGTPTGGTAGLLYNLPAAQYGYYDIAITDIQDRISKKAQNTLAASAAVGTFRIYVNPVPVTQPINHIKNL